MASQRKARSGSGLNRFYVVLALVAIVGAAAVGFAVVNAGSNAATEPIALEGVEDARALVDKAVGVAVGPDDAPVKVIEFADYECPACAAFAGTVKPYLDLNYIQPGRIQYVFYDFPLSSHRNSFLAARAARCAGEQDAFWTYHDAIFSRQSEWSAMGSALGAFVDYAAELGLDEDAFAGCLDGDRFADVVTANYMLGERLGVNATPTVIVNGKRISNPLDYSAIEAAIRQELEASG